MNDEYVRKGETFEITITDDDSAAEDITMTISDESGIVHQKTAQYSAVDGKKVGTIKFDVELALGEYYYMYTVTYADGTIDKYPNISECGGCSLPTFVVCEANDLL